MCVDRSTKWSEKRLHVTTLVPPFAGAQHTVCYGTMNLLWLFPVLRIGLRISALRAVVTARSSKP